MEQSARVRNLLQNCMSAPQPEVFGFPSVRQVCFPGPHPSINLHAEDKCAIRFGRKMIAEGRKRKYPMSWADAVAFSPFAKEPALLLNTHPQLVNLSSPGFLVVLPEYNFCRDEKKILRHLQQIEEQWLALKRLSDVDPEDRRGLARIFAEPSHVFRMVPKSGGCPEVVPVARHERRQAESRPPDGAVQAFEKDMASLQAHTVNALKTYRKEAKARSDVLEEEGARLTTLGAEVSAKGMKVRDRTFTPEELRAITEEGARDLGLSGEDLSKAKEVLEFQQAQDVMAYKREAGISGDTLVSYDGKGRRFAARIPVAGCTQQLDDPTLDSGPNSFDCPDRDSALRMQGWFQGVRRQSEANPPSSAN